VSRRKMNFRVYGGSQTVYRLHHYDGSLIQFIVMGNLFNFFFHIGVGTHQEVKSGSCTSNHRGYGVISFQESTD